LSVLALAFGAPRLSGSLLLPAGEQRRAGFQDAGVADRRDLGSRDLPVAGLAAELADRLGEVAEAGVHAAAGQLAAQGVERQLAAERDAPAPVDERAGLAGPAEAQGLEPPDGLDGEPVVELGHVDVGRAQAGPGPHRRGGAVAHPAQVRPL